MTKPGQTALWLALAALVLVALEWTWLSWRQSEQLGELREDVQILREELARLQRRHEGATEPSEAARTTAAQLQRALRRLDSRNVLERYQAGLTIRDYGCDAVPALIDAVRTGTSRARETALILLGDMQCAAALPALRELAAAYLDAATSANPASSADRRPPPDRTAACAALGILGRMKDPAAVALFQKGVAHREESVRAVCIAGLRDVGSAALLPELAARLGHERDLVQKQIGRIVCDWCRQDRATFLQRLNLIEPNLRFNVVKVLGSDASTEAVQTLRDIARQDTDPRVALSAARLLALRGDQAGPEAARRIAATDASADVQQLAAEVLKSLEPPPR